MATINTNSSSPQPASSSPNPNIIKVMIREAERLVDEEEYSILLELANKYTEDLNAATNLVAEEEKNDYGTQNAGVIKAIESAAAQVKNIKNNGIRIRVHNNQPETVKLTLYTSDAQNWLNSHPYKSII
jgi:hypothetical protein